MGLFDRFKSESKVDLNKRNFTYLEYLINTSEKEVILDSDISLDQNEKFKNGIKVTLKGSAEKSIIVDGEGHFIDAKNKAAFFWLRKPNLSIKFINVNFRNGVNAINSRAKGSNLEFINCTFENNSGLRGSNFENCSFNNNKSIRCTRAKNCIFEKNGGEDSWVIGSGKYYTCEFKNNINLILTASNGYLEIDNCIFINNYSSSNGGVINNSGRCYIYNSKFIGNSASGAGGAIFNYFSGHCSVVNSCFKNNNAETSGGGALFNMQRLKTAYDGTMNTKVGGGQLILGEDNKFYGNTCHMNDGQQGENSVADCVKDIFF